MRAFGCHNPNHSDRLLDDLRTVAASLRRCQKKHAHPLLSGLLAATEVYRSYFAAGRRFRRQLDWLIELAHLLRVQDDTGQPRQARQVKREVKAFLARLEKDTADDP